MKIKNEYLILFVLVVLVFLPFWIHDSSDDIEPKNIEDDTIGYYQSTTCEISLFEVLFNNSGNQNTIVYNNHQYAGIQCFGKVTGLDKVGEKFVVSIGSNTSLLFIIQAFIWIMLIALIKPSKEAINKKINPLYLILPLLFSFQHISEIRYYQNNNIYVLAGSPPFINIYYILGTFLTYYLIFIILSDILPSRENQLINYLPFSFLIIGSFAGMNINFYLLILSYFGIKNFISKNQNSIFNLIYLAFAVIWQFTRRESDTFFDTDKLNGYINSSNNHSSLIFWTIVILLVFNGLHYLYKISEIDLRKLKDNFLFSGSLIVIFGLLGSSSRFWNYFNYILFGQNKKGINKLESIAGNTWRGFSQSAESIGEFYGFILLFILFYLFNNNSINLEKRDLGMLSLILFGLYRTNNFAAISSSILIVLFFLFRKYFKNIKHKRIIYATSGVIFIGLLLFQINKLGYEYLSTHLLYEASLHSNFFANELDNYNKTLVIEDYFNQQSIDYLFNSYGDESYSTSLKTLSNIYFVKFNIPLIPNLVALLSLISLFINRSEMWGIFFAKYSPNSIEAFFGNGPLQFNNYLYSQTVRLDLPPELLGSLYLPHSSVFDLLVFFGIFGLLIFSLFFIKTLFEDSKNNYLKYLLVFLLLNLLKSDSLLYLNSTLLLFLSYTLIKRDFSEQDG